MLLAAKCQGRLDDWKGPLALDIGEKEAQWGCSIHTCPQLGEDGQVRWSTGLGTEVQVQIFPPIVGSVSGSWVALASCPSNPLLPLA